MTRVDFYILPHAEASATQRLDFACRLTEKALANQHRILLTVDDAEAAAALDKALWAFKPESFIPHQIVTDGVSSKCQVEISFAESSPDHHDMLINLATQLPPHFSQFKRLAEIVTQIPEVLESTREHYSYFKQRGYPINHHKLG